jgi:hypothetical protein
MTVINGMIRRFYYNSIMYKRHAKFIAVIKNKIIYTLDNLQVLNILAHHGND